MSEREVCTDIILIGKFNVKGIVTGYNFYFGKNRLNPRRTKKTFPTIAFRGKSTRQKDDSVFGLSEARDIFSA